MLLVTNSQKKYAQSHSHLECDVMWNGSCILSTKLNYTHSRGLYILILIWEPWILQPVHCIFVVSLVAVYCIRYLNFRINNWAFNINIPCGRSILMTLSCWTLCEVTQLFELFYKMHQLGSCIRHNITCAVISVAEIIKWEKQSYLFKEV